MVMKQNTLMANIQLHNLREIM